MPTSNSTKKRFTELIAKSSYFNHLDFPNADRVDYDLFA